MKAPPIGAKAFTGLDVTTGIENLPPGTMRVMENWRINKQGGVFTRPGFKTVATIAGTVAGYGIGALEVVDYQALFVHMDTKIYYSQDALTFYDSLATRTAISSKFFAHGQDFFHFNTSDNLLRFGTSITRTAVTFGATSIQLRVGDSINFTTAGTITIQGVAISYTGNNAVTDTLTGVTGVPVGGLSAGSLILQQTIVSTAPKGSTMTELEGSSIFGGQNAQRDILYYSMPSIVGQQSNFYNFIGTGSGSKNLNAEINCVRHAGNLVMMGGKNSLEYAYMFVAGQGADALLTRRISSSQGTVNASSMTDFDSTIIVFTGTRAFPIEVANSGLPEIVKYKSNPRAEFDYPISSDLQQTDSDQSFSFTHYIPKRREYILSCLINGVRRNYVYQLDSRSWSVDTGKNFSSMTDFKGETYALSLNNNKVYQDNAGVTDDGITILHKLRTGEMTRDQGLLTSDYLSVIFGGNLSGGGEFKFRIFIDGNQYAEIFVSADDLQQKGLMSTTSPTSIGASNIGGSGIPNINVTASGGYKFNFPFECQLVGENIQLEWEVYSEGTALELLKYRIGSNTEDILEASNF